MLEVTKKSVGGDKMADLFQEIKEKLRDAKLSIILPEGNDERIISAALKLQEEGIIRPIIIGNKEEVPSALTVINPQTYEQMDELVAAFVERRKGKVTEEQAKEILTRC